MIPQQPLHEGAMSSQQMLRFACLIAGGLFLAGSARADSLNVRTIGILDTPGSARGVAVSGNYAYVADGTSGLRIINISNPSSPTQAGYYDTPGTANGVAVSGSYAYVADGSSGLRIINISNPSNPNQAGYCDTPGSAYGIAVNGSYAYVADSGSGLRIINISDPASPTQAGYYDTPGTAYGVAVSDSYAYVADGGEGLRIINISNPSSPAEAGHYLTPGAYGVATVFGVFAYVADGGPISLAYGLHVILTYDLSNLRELGCCDTPGRAFGVAVSDSYAYVADDSSGLRIINLGNPSLPAEAGYYDTPGTAIGVAVSSGYAYVADGDGGLRICQGYGPAGVAGGPVGKLSVHGERLRCNPNPFRASTTLRYQTANAGPATLAVYNVAGQKIRSLLNGRAESGPHTVTWDGRDDAGRAMTAGLYLVRLAIGDDVSIRKAIMVK